jgi:hypothetical protein
VAINEVELYACVVYAPYCGFESINVGKSSGDELNILFMLGLRARKKKRKRAEKRGEIQKGSATRLFGGNDFKLSANVWKTGKMRFCYMQQIPLSNLW